jgi:hypothetical protein
MKEFETFFLVISSDSEKSSSFKHEISPVGRNDRRVVPLISLIPCFLPCHLERRERSLFPAPQEISPFGRNDRRVVPLTPLIPCFLPCHLERRERSLLHRIHEISPSGRNDGKRAWWRVLSSRTQREIFFSSHHEISPSGRNDRPADIHFA